ncbi:MAG: AAA family ATPase, partial [Armatimonadota bacterium]|nr:AAA family ATPase [Armatimonadota bacterium]
MTMKIIQLEAENVKRLKAVSITPEGNTVVIGGENGAGKTSVLDSIAYALGGKSLVCEEPVRRGQKKGEVSCTLDEMVVTRTFHADGRSSLAVTSRDGKAKFSSPQAMLDALVGRLTFDPLAFLRMRPAEQLATLKDLVGLDFIDLDAQRRKLYDDRTVVGRDVAGRESQLAAMSEYPDAPAEEVRVAELVAELEAANEQNRQNERVRQELANAEARLEGIREDIQKAKDAIAQWQKVLAKHEAAAAQAEGIIAERAKVANELVDQDTQTIREKIATAEEVNGQVRANQAKAKLRENFERARDAYKNLTEQIEAIDAQKASQMSQANFPVRGLSFGEDGVLL